MAEPVDHSEVQIANRALYKLGAAPISSFSDGNNRSEACNDNYYDVRNALLRAHPWSFAIAQVSLAADNVPPAWGRVNAFALPADFLRMLRPFPEVNLLTLDWVIQGKKIYTNDQSPLYLRYIQLVTDPNIFDPLFREALACSLAVELCETITQSNTKKAGLFQERANIINEAKRAEAIESVPEDPPEDLWLTVRA